VNFSIRLPSARLDWLPELRQGAMDRSLGSNDRLNFAVIGLNGRAYAHLSSLKANRSAARIRMFAIVDSNILKKFADSVQKEMGQTPATDKDSGKVLELKEVDAITIATPDHWHTPIAIRGVASRKARVRGKTMQSQS